MGLYFEEFIVGQKIVTEKRSSLKAILWPLRRCRVMTTASTPTLNSARPLPLANRSRTAFWVAVASGLAWQTGILDGTVIAFREISEWKFVSPVFIGDVVQAEMAVNETIALPRIGGGAVTINFKLRNQKEEICHRGIWNVLVMSKQNKL